MTAEERDRLATLIAAELRRSEELRAPRRSGDTWLPNPTRPEPPTPSGAIPPWSGAGQLLGDLAPVRHPVASAHRDDTGAATAAVRAAAAGKGASRANMGPGAETRAPRESAAVARRRAGSSIEVPVGVSRRHVHLSEAHTRALFGSATLDVHRTIRQPGQFAARQRLSVVGPNGRIDDVRVVGPGRGDTQLELARSDADRLGIDPPLASSGTLEGSLGGVTLVGPSGQVVLARGVIIAARHLHLSVEDGKRWGLSDGDRLDVRCGEGSRAVTWHNVLVRCGPTHATELHLDDDEARAAGIASGSRARIVGWKESRPTRRVLVTERDLLARVQRGEPIPPGALLTPGARDRARALGIDIT